MTKTKRPSPKAQRLYKVRLHHEVMVRANNAGEAEAAARSAQDKGLGYDPDVQAMTLEQVTERRGLPEGWEDHEPFGNPGGRTCGEWIDRGGR